MNFVDAIKSGYQNYVNFSGRSARSAFWLWALFQFVVAAIIASVEGGASASMGSGMMSMGYTPGPIGIVWGLANLLPGLAVSIRRLHDLDKSGWWVLIALIPLIGGIILIVWYAGKGTTGANRFGADPLAA